tara:strand:- start:706 stop:840 length:135 start_codon:yes stop_codon:yes gene_type:complete
MVKVTFAKKVIVLGSRKHAPTKNAPKRGILKGTGNLKKKVYKTK